MGWPRTQIHPQTLSFLPLNLCHLVPLLPLFLPFDLVQSFKYTQRIGSLPCFSLFKDSQPCRRKPIRALMTWLLPPPSASADTRALTNMRLL